METTFQPVDQRTLIVLLREKRSQRVHAYARKHGWNLIVRNGKQAWILADAEGAAQIFPTLDDVKAYLYDTAIPNFSVDTSALDKSSDDLDIRERFSEGAQAAEYDVWLAQQIQEALDDPAPSIPNAVVKERAASRRAELLARLEQEKS